MRSLFRIFAVLILLVVASTTLGYIFWYLPKFETKTSTNMVARTAIASSHAVKIRAKKPGLLDAVRSNNFNKKHCFLIDMSIASGKKRFFVYNLEKDSVEKSGLVTHGSGSDNNGKAGIFSNKSGSNCTSLGYYKIGQLYHGRFGLAYKLHGLNTTNANAFARAVVLHAHGCVPEEEIAPFTICLSLGCPTVSPDFLQVLKQYIDASEKPILLSIYK